VGIALVILGCVAMSAMVITSLAVVIALGILILLGGVAETLASFWCREWSGFFLHLLSGVLSIVIGTMFLTAPVKATMALTLLIAAFLIVGGIFKIVAVSSCRFGSWGWALASGVIDLILGIMIWQGPPEARLEIIGLFVGINMVFRGAHWVAIGLAIRSIPARKTM